MIVICRERPRAWRLANKKSNQENGALSGSGRPSVAKKSAVLLLCLVAVTFAGIWRAGAQTAFIDDAWWTYQQDCNGDGCKAGTLTGERARLNWNPDVTNCNGTLSVFEKVYYKSCASSTWILLSSNSPHVLIGCRSSDAQYLD